MAKEVLIELDNVWKIYDLDEVKVEALKGVSLKIYKKEFIVILGPSGSGKSTMLNSIGSLDTPSKGIIKLAGTNIAHLSESDLATLRGKNIGFVFQTFNLIPSLTALENVAMPLVFQRIPSDIREKKAKEYLEKVNLGHRMHHRPSELSGGERQRVAIARALVNEPEMILADEPTGNLDTKTGQEILKMLKDLHHEGKTIILITHDVNITKYAERVCYIRDGKIEKVEAHT